MNRTIILFFLLITSVSGILAQTISPQSITSPATSSGDPIADSVELAIQDTLVYLALKSPLYSASNHQNKINELELKKAKGSWMNLLSISSNYNDQTFAKQNPNTAIVYPKYFFGVTIPLGVIFSQGNSVKMARAAIANSKDNQEQLARTIKADILSRYSQYKLYNQLIRLQGELINDISAQVSSTEENFKKGSITVDVYLNALKTNNEEISKYLMLKNQQQQLQLEMEKIIGVPLEQIIKPATPTTPSNQK